MTTETKNLIMLPDGQEVTAEQAALIWVNRYRVKRDLPTLAEMPETLSIACNEELKFYRTKEVICWADAGDMDVAKAAYAAGSGTIKPYFRDASNPDSQRWDLSLPAYLWEWSK